MKRVATVGRRWALAVAGGWLRLPVAGRIRIGCCRGRLGGCGPGRREEEAESGEEGRCKSGEGAEAPGEAAPTAGQDGAGVRRAVDACRNSGTGGREDGRSGCGCREGGRGGAGAGRGTRACGRAGTCGRTGTCGRAGTPSRAGARGRAKGRAREGGGYGTGSDSVCAGGGEGATARRAARSASGQDERFLARGVSGAGHRPRRADPGRRSAAGRAGHGPPGQRDRRPLRRGLRRSPRRRGAGSDERLLLRRSERIGGAGRRRHDAHRPLLHPDVPRPADAGAAARGAADGQRALAQAVDRGRVATERPGGRVRLPGAAQGSTSTSPATATRSSRRWMPLPAARRTSSGG